MGHWNDIIHTFVIRRSLTGFPGAKSILAHSALLVLLRDDSLFVLERLGGKSEARCEKVSFQILRTFDYHQEIRLDGMLWTKQRYGRQVINAHTIEEARCFLVHYVQTHPYDSRYQNCHLAQEEIRRWLGQEVPEATATVKIANWIASWIPQAVIESSG